MPISSATTGHPEPIAIEEGVCAHDVVTGTGGFGLGRRRKIHVHAWLMAFVVVGLQKSMHEYKIRREIEVEERWSMLR